MKRQLLCTFSSKGSLKLTMDYILGFYKVSNDRVYLYSEEDDYENLLFFYNIEESLRDGLAKNTISVHRKVHTNSFYTINALNTLITTLNNGVLDKSYQVNWENYPNTLLTLKGTDLKKMNIVFEKAIYL
jgi:hypothetical protein